MRVEELMSPQPATCLPDHDLGCAAKLMWDGDFGCVPVVDGEGKVVGMITDRDITMAALHQGRCLSEIPVSSAMSRDVLTCRPDDDVEDAERRMSERQVRRLPVIGKDGRCVGVLSLNDLATATTRARNAKKVSAADVASTLAAVSRHRQADGGAVM
jgi:CBS domain-containing protein